MLLIICCDIMLLKSTVVREPSQNGLGGQLKYRWWLPLRILETISWLEVGGNIQKFFWERHMPMKV